jgi:hypothetical protein
MRSKLFVILNCFLIGCVFYSCEAPDSSDVKSLSLKDSAKTISDTPSVENNNTTFESVKTDSLPDGAAEKIGSLSELNRRLNKKASHFVITNSRDTVIKCKEGTSLFIPANAFLNAITQSPVVGEVKISVKEFYKISDMLIAGLTTTSDNQLLETGGMINIEAVAKENNDSCILKPGKNIVIGMPNSDATNADGMQLFNGVHGHTHINWTPQTGLSSLAQAWRRSDFSWNQFRSDPGFVFPEDVIKAKPQVINVDPENLRAEIKMSIRDLIQHTGVFTRKANGYIDTLGNLHCYRVGNIPRPVSFTEIYSPTTFQDLKVNLAVDVNLNLKSDLNHDYYQKLFKMGKGKPDSLVVVTATLNPAFKMTGIEKVKKNYKYVETVKGYQKRQKRMVSLAREYEKRIKQLKLDSEEKLTRSANGGGANLQSAQDYFVLSTPKLGWINCDRFYNYPAKVDYLVKLKERASLLIVFNSMKSIMRGDLNGVFGNVPLNEKITIVGLKTENGKLMMAFHETTITNQPFDRLTFQPVTVKEYKSRLERLNGL